MLQVTEMEILGETRFDKSPEPVKLRVREVVISNDEEEWLLRQSTLSL